MIAADLAAAAGDSSPRGVVLLVLLGGVLLAASVARRRRLTRTCARHGHTPEPTTVGTRGETCARCGARLR